MKNPFILDICQRYNLSLPQIEVPLREQYGQVAEDVVVDGLLTAWAQRTGTSLADCRYLEIGANHPFSTSSTILLHRLHGMTGVLVEANESLLGALREARPADEIVYCAVTSEDVTEVDFFISNLSELSSLSREFVEDWQGGTVGVAEVRKVPAQRVNSLLQTHFADTAPVFMSVDIEGLDLDILQDVDWACWRPVIVQAEPSDHFAPNQSKAIANFMHAQGYVLIARTAVNLIFADRATLFGALSPALPKEDGVQIPVPTAAFIAPQPNYSETASVGIVTRTKNRAVLLRRALESVKHQTYPHWQLVVVNDGGDPGPVDELVAAIFDGDARVSVVHHPASVGMEAASNSGLSQLGTELAVIHDDDDSWAPDMLAVATAVLRKKNAEMPSIRGVVTRVNWVLETVTANHVKIDRVELWNEHSQDRLKEGLISLTRLAMQNLYPPIAFIFDLSLARQLGGFDQNLPVLGDWDFNLRFCMEADIWIHPELLAFYHHRQNAFGDMGNTVVAGKAKHELYNAYARNKLLRTASDPVAAAMVLLREHGLRLQEMQNKLDHIHYDLNTAGGRRPLGDILVKIKTKLRAFLSELNRERKRRRKK